MPKFIHPAVQEEIDRVVRKAARDTNSLSVAADWAVTHGFYLALDYADLVTAHEDWTYDRDEAGRMIHFPANRYHVELHIDARHKDVLRPILLHVLEHPDIDAWEKSYYVDRLASDGDRLVETWSAEWGHVKHSHYGHPAAWNAIRIRFHSPAVAGHRLSPTCTVTEQVQHSHSSTYLTVTCSKPASA